LVGDVGLVHALDCEQAVIAGHDFGAQDAYQWTAVLPDLFPDSRSGREGGSNLIRGARYACSLYSLTVKPEDLDYYANEYSRTGLNWCRASDILWQETPILIGRKLLPPRYMSEQQTRLWSSSRGPTLNLIGDAITVSARLVERTGVAILAAVNPRCLSILRNNLWFP
jgi:hypothetical protein